MKFEMEKRQLNLVVFIKEYPVGLAITKKIQNILNYLILQQIGINVISYRSQFKQPSIKGSDNGIPYETIGMGLSLSPKNFPAVFLYFVKGLRLILKFKKKRNNNIFYCIGPVNVENFLFVFWARLLGYKLIFDINEDYSFFEDKVKFTSRIKVWTIRKLDFFTYHWASAIIVVSKHLEKKYLNRTRKHVMRLPVTAKENFNPDKYLFNNPLQVVYAGSFDLKDGVSDIIEGFVSFNNIHKSANLILTGKSDQQLEYKEKYKDNPNLIFKGHLSDDEFYRLLRNADVMCMCRTNSGFSNAGFPFKLGEYLVTGNPVISTKASDVEDYLTSDDAHLIDFNSPLQICNTLLEIAKDPEAARIKGLNGRKKYQKYFSPEINGKRFHDLLNLIVS